jgi:hypothetical protein
MAILPDSSVLQASSEPASTGTAPRSLKLEAAAGAMWVTLEMAMVQLTFFLCTDCHRAFCKSVGFWPD